VGRCARPRAGRAGKGIPHTPRNDQPAIPHTSNQAPTEPTIKAPGARGRPGPRIPPWVPGRGLLPCRASGALAIGYISRRYESHPTGPHPAGRRGLGAGTALLPSARSAPAPAPRPLMTPRGDPSDALPAKNVRRTEHNPPPAPAWQGTPPASTRPRATATRPHPQRPARTSSKPAEPPHANAATRELGGG
jgi:hypothetical protein